MLFCEIGLLILILLHFLNVSGVLNQKMQGSIFFDIVMAAIFCENHSKITLNIFSKADMTISLVPNPTFSSTINLEVNSFMNQL